MVNANAFAIFGLYLFLFPVSALPKMGAYSLNSGRLRTPRERLSPIQLHPKTQPADYSCPSIDACVVALRAGLLLGDHAACLAPSGQNFDQTWLAR